VNLIKKRSFSENLEENLKKSMMNYTTKRYIRLSVLFGLLISFAVMIFTFILSLKAKFPIYFVIVPGIIFFVFAFLIIISLPKFAIRNKQATLESDLLYSARHLLIKIESGGSLINSIESVSKLKTKSSVYFKQLIFDVSMGMSIEKAIAKAIEYSPSENFSRILEEIKTSLKTGADLKDTLKSSIKDITKNHLIQIQEYGKKLNPMSMFYMIIGTILPAMGTAMLVVVSSLKLIPIVVDLKILLVLSCMLLVVQIFFILAFRSLKPAVVE